MVGMAPMQTGPRREESGRSIVFGTMRCSLLENRSDFCLRPEEPLVTGRLQAKDTSTVNGSQCLEGSDVVLMGGTLLAIDSLATYSVRNAGFRVISLPGRAAGGQVQSQAVLEPVFEGILEAPEVDICEGCCCWVVRCVCTGWQCDVHGTNSDGEVVIIVGGHMPPLILLGGHQIDGNSDAD